MIRRAAASLALAGLIAGPVAAQTTQSATGGVVRVLDKINGDVADLELRNGETRRIGRLLVTMGDCRYPAENPSGDAFGWITIQYQGAEIEVVFQGWMIASAPALNAMDHPRYDVWVMRCAN